MRRLVEHIERSGQPNSVELRIREGSLESHSQVPAHGNREEMHAAVPRHRDAVPLVKLHAAVRDVRRADAAVQRDVPNDEVAAARLVYDRVLPAVEVGCLLENLSRAANRTVELD